MLAESLGVTKGGFYGQFVDRNELLREMLDTWAAAVVDQVIDEVESRGGDARTRLQRLLQEHGICLSLRNMVTIYRVRRAVPVVRPLITNKQQLLTQAHALLRKKFGPHEPAAEPRPVLEELVYAILREGTTTADADRAERRPSR